MLTYDERHTIAEAGLVRDFNRLDLKEEQAYDPQYLSDLHTRLMALYKRYGDSIPMKEFPLSVDLRVLIAHVKHVQGKTPGISTDICDSETRGYGYLDHNGYWEFPLD